MLSLAKKVIFLSLFFFFLSLCISKTSSHQLEEIPRTPNNTVFIFNFENMVATHEMVRTAWSSTAAIIGHPWVLLLLLKPSFYRDVVRSLVRNLYTEGTYMWGLYYYLDHLEKAHALFTADLKEALLHAFNKYKPKIATLKIIDALKKSGYRVYIVTDKDRISLSRYIKPYLKKNHRVDLDTFFDGYFCGDFRCAKSPLAMYREVAESLYKNDIQQLVFFDTNIANIKNAHQAHSCFKAFHIVNAECLKEHEIIQQALKL